MTSTEWIADKDCVWDGLQLIAQCFDGDDKANAIKIARSPSMLALLEKAYPIVEEEAERRDMAIQGDSDKSYPAGEYWTEMRELADEISAEIDRAYGKEVKHG